MPISYQQALVRKLPLILMISALAGLTAYGAVLAAPPVYEAHFSYLVSLEDREEAVGQFRYDGFYALQSMDIFTSLVSGWVRTPEIVAQAHEEAGLPLRSQSARELVRLVTAEKTVPELVRVSVKGTSRAGAQALADGLRAVMAREISEYQQDVQSVGRFTVKASDVWVGTQTISAPWLVGAAFFLTLFFGINVVLLRQSLNAHRD